MLSVIMLIHQLLGRRLDMVVDRLGAVCHLGHFLQHHRIVYGLFGVLSPGKRPVVFAQHRGYRHRVLAHPQELADDQSSRVPLVILRDLLRVQASEAGHFAVDVVRMGGAVAGNAPACLGPAGGVGGMGVHNAPDLRKRLIELRMGGSVRGGIVAPLHFLAVQVYYNHIFRRQLVIFHPAGLDDKQTALPVNGADIAPGKGHKTVSGQSHIGLTDNFFQFL